MGHHCGSPLGEVGQGPRRPRAALGADDQGQCALGFPLGLAGRVAPPLGRGHAVEVLPKPSTYMNPPLAPLGSFIPYLHPLLSGLTPTFGVVPMS
jgi:hypothetical protein